MARRQRPQLALITGIVVALGCGPKAPSTTPAATAPASEGEAPAGHDSAPGPQTEHGGHTEHGEHGAHTEHGGHGAFSHRFEDAERWAAQFDDPARDAWQRPDAVIDALALAPDAVIADIGAGTGYFAVRLARAVPQGRVLAVDVEPDMIRYLQQRATDDGLTNIEAIQSTPQSATVSEPIDVAFLCNTYHHVPERARYFADLALHLEAGSRVVIVDFRVDAPDDAPGPPRKHRIPASIVQEELAAAGLRHVSTDSTTLPYQYIAVFEAGS